MPSLTGVQSFGLPARIPPPQEARDVRTAMGAARVRQRRKRSPASAGRRGGRRTGVRNPRGARGGRRAVRSRSR